jgi:integrase
MGSRREEFAALRWGDIDFKWNSITIHDKVEEFRVIPLTPYVAYLLATLQRRGEWVFSSPTAASGRLTEPRIAP